MFEDSKNTSLIYTYVFAPLIIGGIVTLQT